VDPDGMRIKDALNNIFWSDERKKATQAASERPGGVATRKSRGVWVAHWPIESNPSVDYPNDNMPDENRRGYGFAEYRRDQRESRSARRNKTGNAISAGSVASDATQRAANAFQQDNQKIHAASNKAHPNQINRVINNTGNVVKVAQFTSQGLLILTVFHSAHSGYDAYMHEDYGGVVKAQLDLQVAIFSSLLGGPGALMAAGYLGVEVCYPGGVNGLAIDTDQREQEFLQATGWSVYSLKR